MFVEHASALSKEALERELREQAAHVDAALCRLVELVAECGERLDWGSEGVTFARWLAWQCSLPPRVAREHERIGKRLEELPLIRAAFSRGELSYGKVSVLIRVAEPATEEALLELAEALTVSQLARCLAAYRRISAAEAAARQEREFLDCFWTDDGWLSLRGRLAAEEGALFLRALEARKHDVSWLISPHFGNRFTRSNLLHLTAINTAPSLETRNIAQLPALPLGSRIKLDPWDDHVEMQKGKSVPLVSPRDKMSFEVTPMFPNLVRYSAPASTEAAAKPGQ